MSHMQQIAFIASTLKLLKQTDFAVSTVLEVGSYNVNGSVRALFPPHTQYFGVDLTEGPGVDLVYDGTTLELGRKFDLVLASEVFEHDINWQNTFLNMVRHTRKGGIVVFTCASTGRPEHGTTRTQPLDSPGSQAIGWDYYKNLTQKDFDNSIKLSDIFSQHIFLTEKSSQDLYFIGRIGTSLSFNRQQLHKEFKGLVRSRSVKTPSASSFFSRILGRLDYPVRYLLLKAPTEKHYQNYLIKRAALKKRGRDLIRRTLGV